MHHKAAPVHLDLHARAYFVDIPEGTTLAGGECKRHGNKQDDQKHRTLKDQKHIAAGH